MDGMHRKETAMKTLMGFFRKVYGRKTRRPRRGKYRPWPSGVGLALVIARIGKEA
jgi:hypothetical protein